jgi:GNAT superfamily N-acetyltransferase
MYQTRSFTESDCAAVKALVDRTIESSYLGVYPPSAVTFFKDYHSLESILGDAHAGSTLVIEKEGSLRATGTLLGTNVRRMFVDPGMQGRGLGHLLLTKLESRRRACKVSRHSTSPARCPPATATCITVIALRAKKRSRCLMASH